MYKLSEFGVTRLEDGASIPAVADNADWIKYNEWLDAGNTPEPMGSTAAEARTWRNTELNRADVILNRIQDGETGLGTQKAWRGYRVALRNWTDTESFPNEAPVAPDAE